MEEKRIKIHQMILAGEGPSTEFFERTVVSGFAFEDLNLAQLQDYVERRAPGSIRVNGLRLSDVAVSWGMEALGSEPAVFESDRHQFQVLLPSRHKNLLEETV